MPDDVREAVDLPQKLRVMLVLLGLAAAAAGATAVFQGDDGAGAAALVSFGLALVALGILAGHVTTFRAGGIEIETIRRKQAEGAIRDLIAEMATPLGETYAAIREHIPAGSDRTRVMDQYFDVVARQARFGHFAPDEVEQLFDGGGEGGRVVALALMWGDPATTSHRCVLEAIGSSFSAFEQSRGLWLAQRDIGKLNAVQRAELRDSIERGRHHIGADNSRVDIVDRLDAALDR